MTTEGWISLATAVVMAGISIWKHIKAKNYSAALGAAVDGIEDFAREREKRGDTGYGTVLKGAIRARALASGIEPVLHAIVKARTDPPPPEFPKNYAGPMALLLAAGLLGGCSLFGAPPAEETLGARVALDRLDAAISLADATWEANTRAFATELEAAAHAETDQAVLDDLRKLQMEGKLTQESVRELYAWSADTKVKDAADIRGALDKALGTRSRAELKEVWAKVRTYWAARLDADALRADTEAQLRGLLEKSGIQLPGSVDRLFAPRETKPTK